MNIAFKIKPEAIKELSMLIDLSEFVYDEGVVNYVIMRNGFVEGVISEDDLTLELEHADFIVFE